MLDTTQSQPLACNRYIKREEIMRYLFGITTSVLSIMYASDLAGRGLVVGHYIIPGLIILFLLAANKNYEDKK